jgi:hypothetical protein
MTRFQLLRQERHSVALPPEQVRQEKWQREQEETPEFQYCRSHGQLLPLRVLCQLESQEVH